MQAIPVISQGAGLLTLIMIMALIGSKGLIDLLAGKARFLTETRICLTIFGGFLTAGVILTADAAVKALS